ncbi:MAG TPA: type III-B CRISPR-associated protein Cas10/Cmr2 [Chthonomonas sp.]|uniref:type III-B CRISPR-associated protein Cas10/Cmr2 n=1 Tax=Chthonomonas sp. TaxID=2282153 RepID=UPI002B4AEBEE|nr:type III-B CRISPR-associated protein Cas10/Cmr2 [Chthonomonas sp.]HLI49725.1 type III-B CRISPR-associated protein Cas10/Cmr2 [Chthonomonas sp.]
MRNLLTISIGPVQEFIAAARKTADLQAGSNLLQCLACEAANYVGRDGELIFPSSAAEGGANKILVLLHENQDPKTVARECRKHLKRKLMECWQAVLNQLLAGTIDEELANNQVKNFLEFYAAWMPLDDKANYPEIRQELERLLAGRKALRNFKQPLSFPERFKSPLDPSRDTVILDHKKLKPYLQLKESEYLDAISVLKRYAGMHPEILDSCFLNSSAPGRRSHVPSTSEMAFRSLELRLEGSANPIPSLGQLKDFANKHRIEPSAIVFANRLEEEELTEEQKGEALKLRSDFLQELHIGEVFPYYAILAADGDRMGQILSTLGNPEAHRTFSQQLAQFAKQARDIVDQHGGYCIYTGGDDVLALLPLETVIECADELNQAFRQQLQSLNLPNNLGTLSMGIAICHRMEPLSIALEAARNAEKAAKKYRNALAISAHPRSGSPITVVDSWGKSPCTDWQNSKNALRHGLARGFPYELQQLARQWESEQSHPRLSTRLQKEAQRILDRKKDTSGTARQSIGAAINQIQCVHDLKTLADRLAIAHFLTRS